jgi:hypothetical protein
VRVQIAASTPDGLSWLASREGARELTSEDLSRQVEVQPHVVFFERVLSAREAREVADAIVLHVSTEMARLGHEVTDYPAPVVELGPESVVVVMATPERGLRSIVAELVPRLSDEVAPVASYQGQRVSAHGRQ